MASDFRAAARGPADTLVVVVHGMLQNILDTAPDVVAARLPSADLLLPRYDAGPTSNEEPITLAVSLSDRIEACYLDHRKSAGDDYRRIILVGHSRGALMARKAYVLARGETSEIAHGGLKPGPKEWHRAVERIVLLAGLNRGWSLAEKPPKMPWRTFVWYRIAARLARLTGTARLLQGIERGAPFVANLRVQWIRLCREAGSSMPRTIQILGDMDDVVLPGDNIDLEAGRDFVYLNAPPGTTHSNIVELDDAARRDVFLRALDGNDLKSEYVMPEYRKHDHEVQRVVLIMHGIRDFGDWTGELRKKLTKAADSEGIRIETVTSSYGYFPMTKFLLFQARQKNVRWFMDQYTEALARCPGVKTIDFAGHSNGTYLLGSALKRYRSCTFGRVVCAGSVLPRDFEWDELVRDGRIEAIRNYVASGDWVVGIFPNFFERFSKSTDIGGGGFLGFTREPAVSNQFVSVKGGHGAALVDHIFDSMVSFLLFGKVDSPEELRTSRSPFVELCSRLDWAIWILLLSAVVGIGWAVAAAAPLVGVAWWAGVGLYLLLLIVVLNTV